MKITGYVPVGLHKDVKYYYSKKQDKFVDNHQNLFMGDLYAVYSEAENALNKEDWPLLTDKIRVAEISLEIIGIG
jgi:hypothetical protein